MDALHAFTTLSGVVRHGNAANFVAMTTSFGLANEREYSPSNDSLRPKPYISAESNNIGTFLDEVA